MRDIAARAGEWSSAGGGAVVARAISVTGFGGRRAGEAIAVESSGERAGSLLGGTADSALITAAQSLDSEHPTIEIEVPIGDPEAVAAGLACGGLARLLVQDVSSLPASVWQHLADRRPVALATVLPRAAGEPSDSRSTAVVLDEDPSDDSRPTAVVVDDDQSGDPDLIAAAIDILRSGRDATRLVETPAGSVFLEAFVPPSRLVLVAEPSELRGAIGAQATLLGWEVAQHADADDAVAAIGCLGSRDALVVLSHDPELDTPALAAGIAGRSYVGALGSRHTQQARRDRLGALGVGNDAVGMIHGPIGLDIGSRTPEETAVSIFAENPDLAIRARWSQPARGARADQRLTGLQANP